MTFEHQLVDHSDLVILIPDSAGSFCELGYFGMLGDFCPKFLLLMSSEHPESGSFVTDGPVRSARNARAEVHTLDYQDLEGCWQVVAEAIESRRSAKLQADVLFGRGKNG
jgi:hypothetical protein